jgi:hypothetical protein
MDASPVAHVDQGASVGQLELHEQVLDLLWRVHVGFTRHALYFFDLLRLGGSFNVLVVLMGVLCVCMCVYSVKRGSVCACVQS